VSASATFRALPTLFRISFADAVAYRAEMLVWILSTTMPLVMMPLWLGVVRSGPVEGMGASQIVAYFLATFIVRQLTSCWAAWQINFEVRQGTMQVRLLRPVHPVLLIAIEHLSTIPIRTVIALPIAVVLLAVFGRSELPGTLAAWALFVASLLGAWVLMFSLQVTIGALSLFLQSSLKLMDIWFAGFLVFSGYLIPLRMFPLWLQRTNDWLPFRYTMGLPVELLTSAHSPHVALAMLARQWAFALVVAVLSLWLWKRGVKRFSAYGG
jgi:ABC-2 type transport system permease protein